MSLIVWGKQYELGIAPMDGTHREFVERVNRLAAASGGAAYLDGLDELIAHTRAHFEQENDWMRRCGFPPIEVHMGEHARVLALFAEVRGRVAEGDEEAGRRLVDELTAWFSDHAATMDAALAWHMKASGCEALAA
jgi:hemerythrin